MLLQCARTQRGHCRDVLSDPMHIPLIERAQESWRLRFGATPLWQRSFFRNVAVVAGGNTIAQGIALAFSPLITRLYGPEPFGVLGVFTSVASVMIPAATLGYAYSIVLPSRDEDAFALLRATLMATILVAMIATAVVVPFHRPLAYGLGIETAAPYLLLMPLMILWGAMSTTLDQWLIREKQFRASSGITIAERFLINGAKVIAGLLAPVAGTLVVIATLGHGLHALLAGLSSRTTRQRAAPTRAPSWKPLGRRTRRLLNEYRDFPAYRLPQILLNSLAHSLPVVLLALFFAPSPAGFYVLADRVVRFPGTIIASAVGKVFQQRIAEAAHKGQSLRRLIVRATLGLTGAGAMPFAVIMTLGPALFAFVFGPEWRTAGEYARWLGLWLFFGFINGPSVSSISVLALQGHFLAYEVVTVLARAGSLLAGALIFRSELAAIALFSITGAVVNFILIAYVIFQSDRRVRVLDSRRESTAQPRKDEDA